MIVDVCTFRDEFDLWDLHYNVLEPHVDEFIVVEATKTFSGKDRELQFPKDKYPDVRYYVVDDFNDQEIWNMAQQSPNTVGAEHWKLEFYIKENIKKALTHLTDSDIVFVGDVDEIWDAECLPILWDIFNVFPSFAKLKLEVYSYYLNNLSSEEFWGTFVAPYVVIRNGILNHLRSDEGGRSEGIYGWHFTSMGGVSALKQKLTDSYTHESYATSEVLANLEQVYGDKDFLGRNFTYTKDESEWPAYLMANRDKYKHLLV